MLKLISATFLAVSLTCIAGAPAFSQTSIKVDYLKVPSSERSTFTSTVSTRVRTINEQRLAEGKIFAWYHYQVRLPLGAGNHHSDVIVTVFTNPSEVSKPDVSTGFKNYIQESSIFVPVADARSEGYGGGTEYSYITVSFLIDKSASRQKVEELVKAQKPELEKRITNDTLVNWSLFKEKSGAIQNQSNSERYALVARYHGFDDLEESLIGNDLIANLENEEAWKLMEIVEPKSEN